MAPVDLRRIVASVDRVVQRHVPFATARALTRVAQIAEGRTEQQIRAVFDRPTPWAIDSTFVSPAIRGSASLGRAERMYASVGIKDGGMKRGLVSDGGSGGGMVRMGSQNKLAVMSHLFKGGEREWNKFEGALLRVGAIPPGMSAIPGAGAPLDQFGNISRGFLIQMLAYFKAFRESGSKANMTDITRGRFERRLSKKQKVGGVQFFIVKNSRDGRGLAPGIWRRTNFRGMGSAVLPVIIFGRRLPQYRQFIDLKSIGLTAYREHAAREFREAYAEALRTARS